MPPVVSLGLRVLSELGLVDSLELWNVILLKSIPELVGWALLSAESWLTVVFSWRSIVSSAPVESKSAGSIDLGDGTGTRFPLASLLLTRLVVATLAVASAGCLVPGLVELDLVLD